MGLRDRVLDYLAKAFMPVPDHPARGGMTGESRSRGPEEPEGDAGAEERAAGEGDDDADGNGGDGDDR